MTRLSICIPVYNCDLYIGEAIRSVLAENIEGMEVLVVDNCSTDKTVEVVQSFADPRIRLIRNDSNIGMLANWNKSVAEANGEYIKVLPADDFVYPGSLKRQLEILENDTKREIAMVSGRKKIINDSGKVLFSRGYSKRDKLVDGFKAINRTVRSGGNILGEPGITMFRKSLFKQVGPFVADIYYVMDLSLWFKLLTKGKLYSMGSDVGAFRISPVSESIRQIDTQRRDIDNFWRKVFNDKQYRLSALSYRIGLLNSWASAQARKAIYKMVIKG